jgi:hypothetical protein
MVAALTARFPKPAQIYPVYSIIVMLVYGWTLYWTTWKLPSWIYFLPLTQILALYCYFLATNFVESLLALSGMLLLAFVLPRNWLGENFGSRGGMFAAVTLTSLMIFEYYYDRPEDYVHLLPFYIPATLAVAGLLSVLAGRLKPVGAWIEALGENAVIFLYISVPLSLIALAILAGRNLLPRLL